MWCPLQFSSVPWTLWLCLGFWAKLRIWQVPACKIKPKIVFFCVCYLLACHCLSLFSSPTYYFHFILSVMTLSHRTATQVKTNIKPKLLRAHNKIGFHHFRFAVRTSLQWGANHVCVILSHRRDTSFEASFRPRKRYLTYVLSLDPCNTVYIFQNSISYYFWSRKKFLAFLEIRNICIKFHVSVILSQRRDTLYITPWLEGITQTWVAHVRGWR